MWLCLRINPRTVGTQANEVVDIIALAPPEIHKPYQTMPVRTDPPNKAKCDQIFPFWVALGRSRAGCFDSDHGRPWESEIPFVQKAWSDLTAPHHLDLLLAWLEAPGEKNPVAQEASLKAVEACRARVEAGNG